MISKPLAPGRHSLTPIKLRTWAEIDLTTPLDYHVHTDIIDGTASVHQIVEAALDGGIAEVLFSEHVRHTSTYFSAFADKVRELSRSNLTTWVGAEVKILDLEGHLDCSSMTAASCDAIIGSVHRLPPDDSGRSRLWSALDAETAQELEFQLAMGIVTKSRAHILGHPMGMTITNFNLRSLKHLYELACACRSFDKAFELNARYCPSPQDWVELVRRANCKVSFGSDAHEASAVGSSWRIFEKERAI